MLRKALLTLVAVGLCSLTSCDKSDETKPADTKAPAQATTQPGK